MAVKSLYNFIQPHLSNLSTKQLEELSIMILPREDKPKLSRKTRKDLDKELYDFFVQGLKGTTFKSGY